jgi:hypothetical protein
LGFDRVHYGCVEYQTLMTVTIQGYQYFSVLKKP